MPPFDPLQNADADADADATTQPHLLGPAPSDPTYTSAHPADAMPEGAETAAQEQRPSRRRRGRGRSADLTSDTAGDIARPDGEVQHPATPPPPSWDTLTPDYQASWLAHVARDRLVVMQDLGAGARDGDIEYQLYAVDEKTGRLDGGELMTHYRAKASDAYLLSANRHLSEPDQQAEFVACARHARELRAARSARTMAANVGMSRARYPAVWADIPVCTPRELDADLSVIGMPSGVWSIPGHRFLSPEEARRALSTVAIRWDYDPNITHPEALALFQYLYGDLTDTTTMEFARWRQAATALARRPMQEAIVKIAETQSAKSTEGLLQQNAFAPLVVRGERAAIEESSRYNRGGSAHNSYIADFERPARRVNISEVVTRDRRTQRALDGQLLRDLSEATSITYRHPGAHRRRIVPFDAHLFIDGNLPSQGSDILQIADPDSDSAAAIMHRLRGSPYEHIPRERQRPELRDYGSPTRGVTAEQVADVAEFNGTIVRLMCDGMAEHWDLLQQPLPQDEHSESVVQRIRTQGQPDWLAQWVPHALQQAGPDDEPTDTLAIYQAYLAWHDERGEGERPATRRAITEAVRRHYGLQLGAAGHGYLDGRRTATRSCPGWALASA